MNILTMQIHSGFDRIKILDYFKGHEICIDVEGGFDEGYVNVSFTTDGSVLSIWQDVQRFLNENSDVRAVVVCTGQKGWHDYLLLHGAKEGETLDVLE